MSITMQTSYSTLIPNLTNLYRSGLRFSRDCFGTARIHQTLSRNLFLAVRFIKPLAIQCNPGAAEGLNLGGDHVY